MAAFYTESDYENALMELFEIRLVTNACAAMTLTTT